MKVCNSYEDAFKLLRDIKPPAVDLIGPASKAVPIGIDIGKQFGTRIIFHMSWDQGWKLLAELQKRDLPFPSVIYHSGRVLIGAEPE